MTLVRWALGAMLVVGCTRAATPVGEDASATSSATRMTDAVDGGPVDARSEETPTAGTARLIVQKVMSHCLACPEVPMPPDHLLGYEVLVEVRIDGASRATKQNAVCVSDGGASRPGSCALESVCATGVDGGEAAVGQVRCGHVVVELRSGPEGTRSITDGTSHLVDPRPLRILPNMATVRLANHD